MRRSADARYLGRLGRLVCGLGRADAGAARGGSHPGLRAPHAGDGARDDAEVHRRAPHDAARTRRIFRAARRAQHRDHRGGALVGPRRVCTAPRAPAQAGGEHAHTHRQLAQPIRRRGALRGAERSSSRACSHMHGRRVRTWRLLGRPRDVVAVQRQLSCQGRVHRARDCPAREGQQLAQRAAAWNHRCLARRIGRSRGLRDPRLRLAGEYGVATDWSAGRGGGARPPSGSRRTGARSRRAAPSRGVQRGADPVRCPRVRPSDSFAAPAHRPRERLHGQSDELLALGCGAGCGGRLRRRTRMLPCRGRARGGERRQARRTALAALSALARTRRQRAASLCA